MTKVISLYGGPGTGKSTLASYMFFQMKNKGLNVELVSEYVKQWAWEDKKPIDFDQFYLFGKQTKREYSLFGKVDYIITDAPIALNAYYTQINGKDLQAELFCNMTNCYFAMCEDKGIEHVHLFLRRMKKYNPKGRFQTEEEAIKIDSDMKRFMFWKIGISVSEIEGNKEGIDEYLEYLNHAN